MVPLLMFLAVQNPDQARAEALLAAGHPNEALPIAARLVREHPDDARAQLLLGNIHFARPVVGRYAALKAFRTAARLAPTEPEPRYREAEVGFFLGSDEGDRIAREALLELLAITPQYRDAWELFRRLYRNGDISRRASRALQRHGGDPVALERRAELALERGELELADSLAALVLATRRADVGAYLVRARVQFEARHDSVGNRWYLAAQAATGGDSTQALWNTLWMIATPDETRQFATIAPSERRAFFERFWAVRDPNLLTPENERIAEHFRRLAEARRRFALLHPLNLFHRSAEYRALTTGGATDLLRGALAASDQADVARPPLNSGGLGPGVPQTAFARSGLDARGLLWVRHGPPKERQLRIPDPLRPVDLYAVSPHDLEGWLYRTPGGPLTIALVRGSAGLQGGSFGGDFIFFPISQHQQLSIRTLLATDESTLPAPREVRPWRVTFQGTLPTLTDVYFRVPTGTAAAVLWDQVGTTVARDRGTTVLSVTAPPGQYTLGFDIDSAGTLARLRGDLTVPAYGPAHIGVSSLLIASGDTVGDRHAVLSAMPLDLEYRTGRPLACYAEIYGLGRDQLRRARYTVRYTFTPVVSLSARVLGRGGAPLTFEFTREVAASAAVLERLVIDPGGLRPGRYRVTLAVTDLQQGVKSEAVALEITLR